MSATESGSMRVESGPLQGLVDPFASETSLLTTSTRRSSQRYSAFDNQLFSQSQSTASPGQAKRALEAHLSETDRRLEEASKLGTALVQQRKDLADRIKEVEAQQSEHEIGPELRQKLIDVEREFNEIGRDSARAFLAPRTPGGPLSENPASPTKFSSQATDSPSKVTVPSRKQRNQPSNRVHDIEFATEIGTSLLTQVRQLQAVLAERDEALRKIGQEKSQLEVDRHGLTQRIRNLDESEQRYKDENWNLETKTHELMAAAKDSAGREQKLQQSLTAATSEKSAAQRELDDMKQAFGKLSEDHAAMRKSHDADLVGMKKSATQADSDRGALQRRIDELAAQNQELANAVGSRFKSEDAAEESGMPSDPEDLSLDKSDLDHSPPPSPSKGGARNSMLESETLKSSLGHAHRMIQTLKTNVHREKSEKLELKRLLQETREELELRRVESGAASKRTKSKTQLESGKRPAKIGQLGAGRSERTDVQMVDAEWEDDQTRTPRKGIVRTVTADGNLTSDLSESYQTADETEDAYETADEKNTESEAFHTGTEDVAHSSGDDMTETEGTTPRRNTIRGAAPILSKEKRGSYLSTASTTDNDSTPEIKTPVQGTFGSIKSRFRLSRGSKKAHAASDSIEGTPRSSKDSPASFRTSKGQNLAAELGDFENDSMPGSLQATPSRSTVVSRHGTPARNTAIFTPEPPVPKIPMVDVGVMTEPIEHEEPVTPVAEASAVPLLHHSDISTLEIVPAPPAPTTEAIAKEAEEGTDGMKEAASAGMMGSVFGWAMGKRQSTPQPIGDETSRRELSEISPNVVRSDDSIPSKTIERNDQGSQTQLSAQQIDKLLANENRPLTAIAAPAPAPVTTPTSPGKVTAAPVLTRDMLPPPPRNTRRPGSSSSTRAGASTDVPPLPTDHREAIAAAAATREPSAPGSMGPPTMSASAYRSAQKKPQTLLSSESTPYGPGRALAPQNTPLSPRNRFSTSRSIRSRRSSVSSFESEIDARFNIRADGMQVPQNNEGSATDPRMIQAITQTMIGEYLWKYTRKPGRGNMSDKRHRRFFWVHPYTRMLYWSDRDPSEAGRAQVNAKSVAIESVRVITDDNPMPPGLHRKSLMILTPGREIKFTATTGQRHETWFNALSYLLLRSGAEPGMATSYNADGSGITADDVAEFNPTLPNRQSTASRTSLSTYNSRPETVRGSRMSSRNQSPARLAPGTTYTTTGPYGTVVRRTVPNPATSPSVQPAASKPTSKSNTASSRTSEAQAQSGSRGNRLSMYLRPNRITTVVASGSDAPGAASSVKNSSEGGIYDARVVNDSAEDVRAVMAKQDEEADRLENVRACCDGKHDVGSLNHHRHSALGRLSASHRQQ